MITQVTTWKCSNGEVFPSEEEAEKQEVGLVLLKAMKKILIAVRHSLLTP
jgi:hypothetical protein